MVDLFKAKNNSNSDSITIKKCISVSDLNQENASLKSSLLSNNTFNDESSMKKNKKTLHEVTTKDFNRTPKGLMFAKDINDIFCIILICLDRNNKLSDKSIPSKRKKNFFSNLTNNNKEINSESYFCFSLDECIEEMQNLQVNVDMETTSVSISYSIKPEMSLQIIKIFVNAKLLHTPSDRTNTDLNNKSLLQPTPKGLFILTKYIKDMGINKQIPSVVFSNLNSTFLFNFERSSVTDRIIYSDYFIKLIFTKMFNDGPTIWSPNSKADKIASLKTLLGKDENMNEFDFTDQPTHNIMDIINQQHNSTPDTPNPFSDKNCIVSDEMNDENRVSPLYHKFFTNPESDSHVQYYSHLNGLRMYFNREFIEGIRTEKNTIKSKKHLITYSFSTKAIVQWLMDCTDLIYFKEAVIMASLFYKCGLIKPICFSPSVSRKDNFTISKKNLYTFTKKGCDWLDWNEHFMESLYNDWNQEKQKRLSQLEMSVNTTDFNDQYFNTDVHEVNKEKYAISLDSILDDPGKRFLFKSHLDKEMCAENLSAYVDIKKFLKRMSNVEHFVDVKEKNKRLSGKDAKSMNLYTSLKARLMKESNESLSMAYQIFATYIADRSSKLINIDYNLRNSISTVILNSNSSLAATTSLSPFREVPELKRNNTAPIEPSSLKNLVIEDAVEPNNKNTEWPTKTNNLDRKTKPLGLNILNDASKKIINKDSEYFFSNQIINDNQVLDSPTESLVTHSLYILSKLNPLLEDVNRKLYKIMETDSLPKFLNSNKDILDDVKS